MIKEFLNQIDFDEEVYSEVYETKTLYFTCSVGILDGKYPDAESAEISVEIPTGDSRNGITVMISPTKMVDGGYTDYDWNEIKISAEEIAALIMLAPVKKS